MLRSTVFHTLGLTVLQRGNAPSLSARKERESGVGGTEAEWRVDAGSRALRSSEASPWAAAALPAKGPLVILRETRAAVAQRPS
ncbi:hypothetical protein AAFF_G00237210 [Aldrovandia affinis]|uniref:Uncharacterized protein n=1 Tax=Aldrovandia affinis TaxID=143900 RepID=A0AAD7RED8_9TELE|nr:hypothetical protein AAFF_G00237210 [Aldrovandia affinis]